MLDDPRSFIGSLEGSQGRWLRSPRIRKGGCHGLKRLNSGSLVDQEIRPVTAA